MAVCRRRLALLWLIVSAVLFSIMFGQNLIGKFGDEARDAYNWLVMVIGPALAMASTAWLVDIQASPRKRGAKGPALELSAGRLFFWVTFGVSALHLGAALVTVLGQPFFGGNALAVYESSLLMLSLTQTAAAGMLSAFFVARTAGPDSAKE